MSRARPTGSAIGRARRAAARQKAAARRASDAPVKAPPVWLFDLDNTLHDASHAAMPGINRAMTEYVATHLKLPTDQASALREHYWHRYGATLLGLVRHHNVKAAHFLEETHRLPGLEASLRTHAPDRAALKRLKGKKIVLTNAPREYALRVLKHLKLLNCFDAVWSVEDLHMFGHPRPKPDVRMMRRVAVRLRVSPTRCVLVEDSLDNQRAAHAVGMRAVWMQRYLKSVKYRPEVGGHHPAKPAYVYARIRSLTQLHVVTNLLAPR